VGSNPTPSAIQSASIAIAEKIAGKPHFSARFGEYLPPIKILYVPFRHRERESGRNSLLPGSHVRFKTPSTHGFPPLLRDDLRWRYDSLRVGIVIIVEN
jgi:hypothetical protein